MMDEQARISVAKAAMGRLERLLGEAKRLNNLRLHQIVQSLIWIGRGTPVPEVAERLNITARTAYNWLWEFAVRGFSWLGSLHYHGRGRKARLSTAQKDALRQMVDDGPEKCGYTSGVWNSAMIADLVFSRFGVKYVPRYLCALLHKIGLSYQKARFISDKVGTAEFEESRRKWAEVTWPSILRKAKASGASILFIDEASFAMWGSLARTWGLVGKQPTVKTKGVRRGLKMFGAIDFRTGRFVYEETPEKFNSQSYLGFLSKILSAIADPVIIVEDGAPYHQSKIIKTFKWEMEAAGRLFAFRLPSFSPDLNPIEKLWKNTKRDATHLKYFKLFEDLRSAVTKAFEDYMWDATKVIRVMAKLRDEAQRFIPNIVFR
jgi:transposase